MYRVKCLSPFFHSLRGMQLRILGVTTTRHKRALVDTPGLYKR